MRFADADGRPIRARRGGPRATAILAGIAVLGSSASAGVGGQDEPDPPPPAAAESAAEGQDAPDPAPEAVQDADVDPAGDVEQATETEAAPPEGETPEAEVPEAESSEAESTETEETAAPPPPVAEPVPPGLGPAAFSNWGSDSLEQGPLQPQDEGEEPSYRGYIVTRTRGRWAVDSDQQDHDLFGVAAVDISTGGANPYKIHIMGRGAWDMDGKVTGSDNSIFFDIEDTYNSSVTGRLYYAYVDAPIPHGLNVSRAGRQIIYDTPVTAYFDGLTLETAESGPTRVNIGAYGGIPVREFRSSYQADDLMGGIYTNFSPWEKGRMRLEWMHLEDEQILGEGNNDLLALKLQHAFQPTLRLEGTYSRLESKNRDASVRGLWTLPEDRFSMRLSYYRLLEPQGNLANELNPFFNSLHTFYPYGQGQFHISKGLGDSFELAGGADIRRVEQEEDIGAFNRDFDRYFVTGTAVELLPLDTSLSLTFEDWDSPGNANQSWGLDLTSNFDGNLRASIGSFFSLYKYYLDTAYESDNVRTYYARVRKKLSDAFDVGARYEFEDTPEENFHYLRLELKWQF